MGCDEESDEQSQKRPPTIYEVISDLVMTLLPLAPPASQGAPGSALGRFP